MKIIWDGSMAQVVNFLPCKLKAQSSKLHKAKNKQQKQKGKKINHIESSLKNSICKGCASEKLMPEITILTLPSESHFF